MDRHELNRMFDRLAPTQEQEQAGLDRLLQTERKVYPVKKLKKWAVAGIAAAIMLVTCAAAVVTGIDQKVLGYFGIMSEQEPLMAPTAVRVEKSHAYGNGWNVNIRQAMSDRYSMAVLIDVTAPVGTSLNGEASHLWLQAETPGDGGTACGSYYLADEDLEDNHAAYLFLLSYGNSRTDLIGSGSVWKLTPEFFLCVEQDGTSSEVALGNWTCTVFLSKQDPGVLYEIGQPISIWGYEITLDQIYVSPISFSFHLKHIPSGLWDSEFGRVSEDWAGNIVLHTASGETVKMKSVQKGSLSDPDPDDPDTACGHYQFAPEQIVDPAEIVSVTIFGQTFALK